MFKDKNMIYSMILSICVFIFLFFHLVIVTILSVPYFPIFEIIILLFIFDFILSILLSYKFYKIFRKKSLPVIRALILTDFVIVVLYFVFLLTFLVVAAKTIDFNAFNGLNFLPLIFIFLLLYIVLIPPLMIGYKFYYTIMDSKSHIDFEIKRKNFFKGESKIRFGFIGGDRFNVILVTIIMFAIFCLMYSLNIVNFDGDFTLIFKASFSVFLVITLESMILKGLEFISALLALALFILLFIFCLGLLGIIFIEFESIIFILLILALPMFIYLSLVIIENKIWN